MAARSVVISELRQAFSGRLISEPFEVEPFLVDWRGKWRGSALAVVQPDSAEDVAAVVRWCAEHGVAITPQGGNTGLSGGAVPNAAVPNIVVSLARLNRIRNVDTMNNTITVEAGCILQKVQRAADGVHRLFPLSLAAEGSCTIGGNLATNAGGTGVLRYGNARELCLGLEVVTPTGEIWNGLRGLRKDNTGYDLKDLFIGSEGTLGIITAGVLKLYPAPRAKAVALAAVADVDSALEVLRLAQARLGAALTACELFSQDCLSLVCAHVATLRSPFEAEHAWYVLIEATDLVDQARASEEISAVLEQGVESEIVKDAIVGASGPQNDRIWGLRETISEAQGKHGKNIKHDVSLPISQLPKFVAEALGALRQEDCDVMPIVFGHLGDGNLHFNLSVRGSDGTALVAREAQFNRIVHDLVHRYGGSISAEHGLGLLRREESARYKSTVELALMKSIKQAIDPRGLMNPGKVLP